MRGTPLRVMTYPRRDLLLDLLASGLLPYNDEKSTSTYQSIKRLPVSLAIVPLSLVCTKYQMIILMAVACNFFGL
jgi:hypothetical protein